MHNWKKQCTFASANKKNGLAPWLNWIEHLTTDQKVVGLNPAGVTFKSANMATYLRFFLLIIVCWRLKKQENRINWKKHRIFALSKTLNLWNSHLVCGKERSHSFFLSYHCRHWRIFLPITILRRMELRVQMMRCA